MVAQLPGRVGDACVAGGAAYADDEVGGCGSTGDGDLHLRFQPCYQASFWDLAFARFHLRCDLCLCVSL